MKYKKDPLATIKEEIESLPSGSLSRKPVNGHLYWYHRWYENGKLKEKYVPESDVDDLRKRIQRRKDLKETLQTLEEVWVLRDPKPIGMPSIKKGRELEDFISDIPDFKTRSMLKKIEDYLNGPNISRVLILYGLRRTGKTTMMKQAISRMGAEQRAMTAYVYIDRTTQFEVLGNELEKLAKEGIKYFFLDEISRLDGLITNGSWFSDVLASGNRRVVMSGKDSLSFYFAEGDELYDRTMKLHTTWIPYTEFSRLVGVSSIDDYLRSGGILSPKAFSGAEETRAYVLTSIADNIQHSLENYNFGGMFDSLKKLYENDELRNAIERLVEDMNHQFTIEVITRDFISHDLGISARNLRFDKNSPNTILTEIDKDKVTNALMERLSILNSEEQNVKIDKHSLVQLKKYMEILDLIFLSTSINAVSGERSARIIISQPGLRYNQCMALLESLKEDPQIALLGEEETKTLFSRIESEILGRMMEDVVILETAKARQDRMTKVFTLNFLNGEYDMVVYDQKESSCEIYEIKHSDKADPSQYRDLVDETMLERTRFLYGEISSRHVIYRGESCEIDGIGYLNVEEYLKSLKKA